MQYVADQALHAHGADGVEMQEQNLPEGFDEETTYVIELPTKSVEASLGEAIKLQLRPDPDAKPGGLGAACGKASALLLGGNGDDEGPKSFWEGFAAWAERSFPVLTWLPATDKPGFKADLVAGLTVGVMVIPQSMSYASIAGLELVYGLYASMTPTLIYALLGGSGQLAVGPVALVSLLVAEGLGDALTEGQCPEYYEDDDKGRRLAEDDSLAGTCPKEYAELVFVCMFFVGILQFGAALLKLDFVINFLGHPVISGFTSGAAIIIGLSQVKYWLGISLDKSPYAHKTFGQLFGKIFGGEVKWMCLILGIASYYGLKGIKELATRRPKRFGNLKPMGPLIICTLSLVMMILFPVLRDDYGVEVIGLVPRGAPPFSLPQVLRDVPKRASTVLPTAISAALIGFMESIAIGKSLAAKHGDELDAGQEMAAIGLANLVGSFASGYPVAGSFSRSAVSNSTGARSPLAGMITGIVVLVALLILPSWVRKLPKFVLASIVISSVVNLVAVGEAKHLWKVRKADFFLWVLAFLGTLFLGVLYGLAVAVGMSLIIVLYESVRPQIAVLWKLPGTAIYRNVKQGESPGQFVEGVLVVRVGASMYFANVAYIKDSIMDLARRAGEDAARYVVVEMTPVMTLDSTAIHMIEDLFNDWRRRGGHVCLASCGSRVEDILRRAGVQRHMGYEWFHENVGSAVEFCVRHAAASKALVRQSPKPPNGAQVTDEDEPQGGMRQRKPAPSSAESLKDLDKSSSTKSVLVLAAKHRVVDKKPEGRVTSFSPEERAIAELDNKTLEAPAVDAPPPAPAKSPASLERKRDTLQALRLVVRQNGGMSGGRNPIVDANEAVAPPEVVAVPDSESPDVTLSVACDMPDRPGLLRDISDVLASNLALQVRYTEAAAVGKRSITFWRCEVPVRGTAKVLEAAAAAEELIPKVL